VRYFFAAAVASLLFAPVAAGEVRGAKVVVYATTFEGKPDGNFVDGTLRQASSVVAEADGQPVEVQVGHDFIVVEDEKAGNTIVLFEGTTTYLKASVLACGKVSVEWNVAETKRDRAFPAKFDETFRVSVKKILPKGASYRVPLPGTPDQRRWMELKVATQDD
jgi:hypothetical protein